MSLRASDLRRINRIFEYFGRAPNGALRIMWKDLSELFYFIERDQEVAAAIEKEDKRKKSGKRVILWGIHATWERFTWQFRYGNGYCLCVWKPAIPRDQFLLRYGTKAPYNGNGEYHLIENTVRGYDDPPNERNSALLKDTLMEMFYHGVNVDGSTMKSTGTVVIAGREMQTNQVLDALVDAQRRKHEATRKQIESEIDDLNPAFGNLTPGKRGHNVSFGGIGSDKAPSSDNRIIIPG